MSRRHPIAWLAACVCLIAGAAGAPTAQAAGANLAEAGNARFPERAWILTLPPGATTPASAVDVTENDRPVSALRVAPASAGGGGFGVVLAIDTSKSMTGKPIADAMAAAREFARLRPAGQRLGIVTFNSSEQVLLKPTTNAAAIDEALAATPALAPGTHLYDASSAALGLIGNSGLNAGAVVVLTDGSDIGSTATPAAVGQAARRAHARVFTVGSGSSPSSALALRDLATQTSGEYLGSATGTSLTQVYRRLGGQLASAYLVRYRSLQPTGRLVRVSATAGPDRATADYRAPSLAVSAADTPRQTPFLASTAGIALVAIVALFAAFVLIGQLLALRGGRDSVRDRVGSYGAASATSGTVDPTTAEQPSRSRHAARRTALGESLEIARMHVSPEAYVGLWALGGIVLTLFAVVVSGTLLLAPVAALGTYLAARAFLASRVERQRAAFAEQLPDGLQTVASAMRTGHSFTGGLAALVEESAEPLASEFGRVVADERVGVPLEEALGHTIRRMDNRDLEQVALVAVLQRETGGNGAEALDRVVENLRGREEVRRLVRTLTAQGRMSRAVLSLLPVAMLAVLSIVGDAYTRPLFTTTVGNLLLILGAVLVAAGSLVIKRLIEIKV